MSTITIPHNFYPRHYQLPFLQYMEAGGKRGVCKWHRRCIARGTRISMADGSYKYIEDIVRGDKVLAWAGDYFTEDVVVGSWFAGEQPTVCLNDTITVTPDHRFLTNRGVGYKRIDACSFVYAANEGVYGGHKRRSENVKHLMPAGVQPTYDIETEKYHNFVANGYIVHNSGKDKTFINFTANETQKRMGLYAYLFPTYKQGRKVLWNGIDRDGFKFMDHFPEEIVEHRNNTEMTLYLKNGSIFQIFGTDDIDAFMGTNPFGCVFTEYSLQIEGAWDHVRPILRENDGWAVFNWCVDGDTLVLTSSGMRRIKKDVPEGFTPEDIDVYGLGGFHRAESFYNGGVKDTLTITTKMGYSLTCTTVHPVWSGSEWIKSEQLKVGDKIPIQRGQQAWGNDVDISGWVPPEKRCSHKDLPLGFKLSNRTMYLMGLILAEGSWTKGTITISNKDTREIRDFLTRFGFTQKDEFHHTYCSQELVSFIEWFGLKRGAKNKDIPDRLLSLPKDFIASFLRGYFDGDGSSHKKRGVIHCDSVSERLIKDLQVLLLNFGIVSSRKLYTVKPTKKVKVSSLVWRLEICGYSAHLFYEQIRFKLERKQKNGKSLSERQTGWYNDCVDVPREVLDDFIKGINATDLKRHTRVSYQVLKNLLEKKDHPAIRKIVEDNFYYDEIAEIVPSRAHVYDFVIPETHSFFSNGFISHNTPRGRNHAFKLGEMAKHNKRWFFQMLTVENTYRADGKRIITDEMIQEEREEGMSEAMIQQEYFCSDEASLEACFFGDSLARHTETEVGIRGALETLEDGNIRFVPDEKGILELWEKPYRLEPDWDGLHWEKRYSIGSDIAEGLGQDYSVAHVYDRHTKEIIARMRTNKVDAHTWGDMLDQLSVYFERAIIVPERAGAGITTCKRLVELKANVYFNTIPAKGGRASTRVVGWVPTKEAKYSMAGDLREYFMHTPGRIRDVILLQEASVFIKKENEKLEADDGFHDDTLISAGLSILGSVILAKSPTRFGEEKMKAEKKAADLKKLDGASRAAAMELDQIWKQVEHDQENLGMRRR